MVPGAKVAEIARRHAVSRGLIYTWRREARQGLLRGGAGQPELVPVVVSATGEPSVVPRRARRPRDTMKREGTIEITLPSEVRVTVRGCIEAPTLRIPLFAFPPAIRKMIYTTDEIDKPDVARCAIELARGRPRGEEWGAGCEFRPAA